MTQDIQAMNNSGQPDKKQMTLNSFFGSKAITTGSTCEKTTSTILGNPDDPVDFVVKKRRVTVIESDESTESDDLAESDVEVADPHPSKAATIATDGVDDESVTPPPHVSDDEVQQPSKTKKKKKKNVVEKPFVVKKDSEQPEWVRKGLPVPFKALADTFALIEATSKRLEITELLRDFLLDVIRTGNPVYLIQCVNLCTNRIAPAWEMAEIGVGEALIMKAVAAATGRDVKHVRAHLHTLGDLGSVAAAKSNQKTLFKPTPLNVSEIFAILTEMASFSGNNAQNRKVESIKRLLLSGDAVEAKYIIRTVERKLGIGLAEQTVLVSLGHAFALHGIIKSGKSIGHEQRKREMDDAAAIVKQAYSELPTFELIIPSLFKHGYKKLLEHCKITPGIPLKPMLANPTRSISEVLDNFQGTEFVCEFKYDGQRAQIHKLEGGKTYIFSRNHSENMMEKYPDIMGRISSFCKPEVTSFILDGEVMAWDPVHQRLLPFQSLAKRKKKNVEMEDIQVQVVCFVFDLLYFNGKPLTELPLRQRREMLFQHFVPIENQFYFTHSMVSDDVEVIQNYLDESIEAGCEGLMVKTLDRDASYEPSKRSHNWLKVKKDYLENSGDSFDVVVIGAYLGKGKRTGRYGAYLVACYNSDRAVYESICKVGTGFSDAALTEHYESLQQHIIAAPKRYYMYSDEPKDIPDVWFDAQVVWEIKGADMMLTDGNKAASGLIEGNKGVCLRFPRFLRVRDDKAAEQATSNHQIADMYKRQSILNQKSVKEGQSKDDQEQFIDDGFEY